ncbi:hypothetical protein BES34_013570 [Leptospira inadai serovar Lyme]|uniref:Lipoprotein n=1 Tax=Leptospira inadai serovar Lyme TaxID=293084 RepID=A0ABX4YGL0_9LEPT|nr:hypothetical protein BES34_013570 [Leptospira inadai serovar Lyme]
MVLTLDFIKAGSMEEKPSRHFLYICQRRYLRIFLSRSCNPSRVPYRKFFFDRKLLKADSDPICGIRTICRRTFRVGTLCKIIGFFSPLSQ